MGQIIHTVLGVILGIIVFSLPFVVGRLLNVRSISLTFLCGQLILWAVFQIIAVPMVYFRAEFSSLFWTYTGVVAVLTAVGVYTLLRSWRSFSPISRMSGRRKNAWWKRISPFLIIAMLIIGYQMCIYIFGMHLDEDDARWIAEANDALVKNRMLLHNPATGEYIGRFVGEMVKDVFSPWSMYLAVLSRWTTIRAATVAHTIYPPILLCLSYSAYYEIGTQLFGGKKSAHERGIFLLMVSVINLFMAGNAYTKSVFTLTRIWQGKAVVAAVMIPSILAIILRVQRDSDSENQAGNELARKKQANQKRQVPYTEWLILFITGAACCLFSGMGIAIGFLMITAYGAYVVIRGMIQNPRSGWKQIPLWILSLAPNIVFGFGFFQLRG